MAHEPSVGLPLLVALALAGAASAVLTGLALAAFARRRSRSYLLIALAIAALLARTVIAGGAITQFVSPPTHHLSEHVLDVAMAALVVAAVYYARQVETETVDGGYSAADRDEERRGRDDRP